MVSIGCPLLCSGPPMNHLDRAASAVRDCLLPRNHSIGFSSFLMVQPAVLGRSCGRDVDFKGICHLLWMLGLFPLLFRNPLSSWHILYFPRFRAFLGLVFFSSALGALLAPNHLGTRYSIVNPVRSWIVTLANFRLDALVPRLLRLLPSLGSQDFTWQLQ